MKTSTKRAIAVIAIILFIIGFVVLIIQLTKPKPTSETQFINELYSGEVAEVYVTTYSAKVLLKKDAGSNRTAESKPSYTLNVTGRNSVQAIVLNFHEGRSATGATYLTRPDDPEDQAAFDKIFKAHAGTNENGDPITIYKPITQVKFYTNDLNSYTFVDFLPTLFLILIMAGGIFLLFRAMNGSNKQAISFSKSKARLNDNIKVRFSDVAGADEEKEELQEIVEFLKNPKKFSELGARIPKGVLLVGPPGTGKTLFAKAVAGEANVPFFSISGSDFVEMFVGVGASRVRDLFDQAKKNMPCILFIDEIDAVGRQRGTGLGGGHDEREQTLNQLLVQMDGFETNEGIIIMAATNRADILDPALLRPGRFDRQIYVHVPDVRGRELIFKVHARNKPMSPEIDYKVLARITSGFTGADIENVLNEAAILAARANRKVIIMADVNEGINKVVMGPQKKSRLVTEFDKRITAYHEAGHAIIAAALPSQGKVHEVTIIGRGQAAGYTMTRPSNDDNFITRNMLMDRITMSMGGRAAEEIVIKDFTAGAQGDLKQSTEIAKKMVMEFGMSDDIGPIFLGGGQEVFLGRDYQSTHSYSEQVASQIDVEIKKVLTESHSRAVTMLTEKRDVLDKMARLLIERETIYTEEVQMLMEGKSLEEINDYMDNKQRRSDSKN